MGISGSPRGRATCAPLLVALGSASVAVGVVLAALDPGGPADGGLGRTLAFLAFPGLVFFAVGAVLAVRRPETAVGWLCLVIGVLWLLLGTQIAAGNWAVNTGRLGLGGWLTTTESLWAPAVGLTGTHLLLRLPNGTLPSPAWRRYAHACTLVIVLITAMVTLGPPDDPIPGVRAPLAVDGLDVLGPLFILLPLSFLGSIASLVVRYRRSHGVERLQLRWIAFGGLVCVGEYVLTLPLQLFVVHHGDVLDRVLSPLTFVTYAAVPVTIAIAVLRYRLYDIDVVINRTLVYLSLTVTLAGTYLGSVVVLQLVLRGLTGGSGLAVAGSTLVTAAIVGPARARLQGAVDRRFFRARYDAAQTLARFGGHLRDEVDLEALSGALRDVVSETMQPAHVSLWLREGAR